MTYAGTHETVRIWRPLARFSATGSLGKGFWALNSHIVGNDLEFSDKIYVMISIVSPRILKSPLSNDQCRQISHAWKSQRSLLRINLALLDQSGA
jgi:hypothetical protein